MEENKPCYKCGSNNLKLSMTDSYGWCYNETHWYVICLDCNRNMKPNPTEKDAWIDWNTRA